MRELTSTEQYAARKMGSKLARALFALSEAQTAARALGQDCLREMDVAHFMPQCESLMRQVTELHRVVRAAAPAPGSVKQWEERRG